MNKVTQIIKTNGNGAWASEDYVLNGKIVSGSEVDRAMADRSTPIEKDVILVQPSDTFNVFEWLKGR